MGSNLFLALLGYVISHDAEPGTDQRAVGQSIVGCALFSLVKETING